MAELVLGKYDIIREIARSNDIVYEARDSRFGRTVALKELNFPAGITGQAKRDRIERFNREARAAGRLTHPNIVSIFDVGEDAGRYFIAMEYLDGQSLRESLVVNPQPGITQACNIVINVLEGLHHAHINRVIHRDIKPDNIFLLKNDVVKITDFGIARITEDSALTSDGQVFGTPSYMSPEQIQGQAIDHRTDIFSTGVMLYEMIAGRKPFTGDSVIAITYAVANTEPAAIQGISMQLDSVIRRALQKSAANRYEDCSRMIADLKDALNNVSSSVRSIYPSPNVQPVFGNVAPQTPVHPVTGLPMNYDPATGQWWTVDPLTGVQCLIDVTTGLPVNAYSGAQTDFNAGVMSQLYDPNSANLPFDWDTGQPNTAIPGAKPVKPRQPRGPLLTNGQKVFLKLVVTGVVLGLIIAIGSMATMASYRKYQRQREVAAIHNLMSQGESSYKLGHYQQAATKFQSALARKPDATLTTSIKTDLAYCYVNLAQRETKANNLQQAVADYKVAIQYKPDYSAAHTELASVQETLNNYQAAAAESAAAQQLESSSAPPPALPPAPSAPSQPTLAQTLQQNAAVAEQYYEQGYQFQKQGDLQDANTAYNRAVSISATSPGGRAAQQALSHLYPSSSNQ